MHLVHLPNMFLVQTHQDAMDRATSENSELHAMLKKATRLNEVKA